MSRKKLLLILVALACLGVVVYLIGYLSVASSDAFSFAERKIKDSTEIRTEVGEVLSVKLAPQGPFNLKVQGSHQRAMMAIDVSGARRSIEVDVSVEKTNGQWQLNSMKIR
jgi:hypothetical protein